VQAYVSVPAATFFFQGDATVRCVCRLLHLEMGL